MAKKIIISFTAQPIVGVAFDYTIRVDGVNLVYPNGLSHLTFQYQAHGGTDPTKVALGVDLTDTINATILFLNANYSSPGIVYTHVNNTIEVSININDKPVVVYVSTVNPSIAITTIDVSNITFVNLKYFFQYKNIVGDTYLCQIFKKNYTGDYSEINGTAIIEKASVVNHLNPIRGGGVTLKLEANVDLTLEDLYSEAEQDFTVKLFKNNVLMFHGYLNPDGVYQDYVRDGWIITLDCVDGLGAIANLSFVQDNGLLFIGKMQIKEIIYRCLKRTGILMPINYSVNITYDGYTDNGNGGIFRDVYLDANRFKRVDDNTIMSCEDVLKSILDIFKACITQWDGEWYIYKPNEIFLDPYVTFNRFDITNNYVGNKKLNLNKTLGSQIDNFYPHHCSGNQKIEIRGSVGGFRIGYKYGKVSGLLDNPSLIKNVPLLEYDNWTIDNPTGYGMLNDPLRDHGFLFKNFGAFAAGNHDTVICDPINVTTDDDLSLKLTFDVVSPLGSSYIKMHIKQGIYYLNYRAANDQVPIEDFKNAVWSTDSSKNVIFFLKPKNGSYTLQLPKILSDGTLTVSIEGFLNAGTNSTTFIDSLDVIPSQNNDGIEGEFHTVERANRVSTIVKENQTVYNGDNAGVVYLGAIYDINLNPTVTWNRKNSLDHFPILHIAAEEELRIAQRPTKLFTGDFFGYIPYLSLININNIGSFMPIEWSYDTATNVTTCKQLELFAAELTDIVYKFTFDYGQTVKPTIK